VGHRADAAAQPACRRCDRAVAYAAYRAALEREEDACSIYRRLLDELATAGARPRSRGQGDLPGLAGVLAESRDG